LPDWSLAWNCVHMPELICPYCKESFDAAKEDTESCRKAACVKANQRAKKRAAAGVKEVKRGRPRKSGDSQTAGWVKVIRPTGISVGPCTPEGVSIPPVESAPAKMPHKFRHDQQANHHGKAEARRVAAGDVNALARNVILSKVPTKKTEDDSMEARVKRLEAAMKQFSKKKGGES